MSEFFDRSSEESKVKHTHTLWPEKYRPSVLNEYVGNELLKKKVKLYIETNDIPHLLLYGPAGTGKTTLAKLIVSNIDCDHIYINASDERGIDIIRNKVKVFASSAGFSSIKVVILDEADYITPEGQAALRNLMETFSQKTRFILTCNFHERIISPIQSRCQLFGITPPSKKEVGIQLLHILESENIQFQPMDIKALVDNFYPDIRKIINNAQLFSVNGKLELDDFILLDTAFQNKILSILKSINEGNPLKTAFKEVRQVVADNKVTRFEEVYKYLFDNVDEFAPNKVSNAIIILADAQYKDVFVVDHEINFMSCIIQLLSI